MHISGSFIAPKVYTHQRNQETDVLVSIFQAHTLTILCKHDTHFRFVDSSIFLSLTLHSGSMADVPKDLLQTITTLQEQFKVPTEKLKEITAHFIDELEKGKQLTRACAKVTPF